MDVELRQLRALVALADSGTFTDAAAELGLSQAAVSRSIQALETGVGARLVHRTTRTVAFSPVGTELLTTARRILDDLDRMVARARGETRGIRLGYAWAALGAHTTPILRTWNREHPERPIRMVHAAQHDVGLRDGRADLAIVRHAMDEGEFESAPIGREARVCTLAVDHPLAERATIGLADLVGSRVGVDTATGTTSAALWLDRGLAAPEIVPTQDTSEWLDLVAEGRIVGVTPVATEHYTPRPGVVFIPMPSAPTIQVRLAWPRGRRPAETDQVLRHLRAYYRGADAPSRVGGGA